MSAPISGLADYLERGQRQRDASLNRRRAEIVVNLDTGAIIRGNRVDNPVPLASVTKLMTAATIFHLNNTDSNRRRTYSDNQMGRFLSRSTNEIGDQLARQTSGSVQAFVAQMNEHARRIGMQNSNFTNTTGLNPDGVGPTASPADVARLLSWFHRQPGGDDFLRRYASPDSGFGHTMSYAFEHGGVIGAKTGTNPQAGDVTGAVLFRGANNQTYATFIHTNNTGERPTMISQAIQAARSPRQQVIGQLDLNQGPTRFAEGPQSHTPRPTIDEDRPRLGLWSLNASRPQGPRLVYSQAGPQPHTPRPTVTTTDEDRPRPVLWALSGARPQA